MQKLFLIRHGESAGTAPGKTDFDRKLTAKGMAEISALGLKISTLLDSEFVIVSSSAIRTRQTAKLLSENLSVDIHFLQQLYNGTAEDYKEVIGEFTRAKTLVLIGHNPAISELAFQLSGTQINFHPGTCVIFTMAENECKNIIAQKIERIINPDRKSTRLNSSHT